MVRAAFLKVDSRWERGIGVISRGEPVVHHFAWAVLKDLVTVFM